MGRTTIRSLSRFLVVGIVAATTVISLTGTSWAANGTYAAEEVSFAAKINNERTNRGLPRLVVNLQLTGVARGWTDQMASAGSMSHNPRVAAQVEGDWTRLGENVGYSTRTGASTADLVSRLHVAFMESPGHRANVLGDYNQVGVGVRMAGDTMWVTVNFMKAKTVVSNGAVAEASNVASQVFAPASDSGRHASYVVVTASDQPGHALGAASLASDDGPLLYTHGADAWETSPVLHPVTRAAIDRLLGGRGLVYVVGNARDVSGTAVRELVNDGYTVKRLVGSSQAATLARVATETVRRHGDNGSVVIGRADQWGYSVAAAMWAAKTGTPFLLTGRTRLAEPTRQFLAEHRPTQRWVVGPRTSIAASVQDAARAKRLGGANPAAVSVRVSKVLWQRTTAADGNQVSPSPGYGKGRWAYSLAHAPAAAVTAAPGLLVRDDSLPAPVATYLSNMDYRSGVRGQVRAATPVSRQVVDRVAALVAAR
jgi:uncharacterized protein YkwD